MITTDHHGPHEGNSGRGTSSGPVSADTVSRASPDLPACYGGGMSADTIPRKFRLLDGLILLMLGLKLADVGLVAALSWWWVASPAIFKFGLVWLGARARAFKAEQEASS